MWLSVVQIGDLRNYAVAIASGDLEFVSLSRADSSADTLNMQLRYLDQEEAEKVETLLGISSFSLTPSFRLPILTFKILGYFQ